MEELNKIFIQIKEMGILALQMWEITFSAFMEHNPELFQEVTERENKINELEKKLIEELIDLGKITKDKEKKKIIMSYMEIIGDIEIIGDYCKDVLERIEIKVAEKLLFSEDAVNEYKDLYYKTHNVLERTISAFDQRQIDFLREIIKECQDNEVLAERYREHHEQRLLDGICSPFAGNMFLNMIDFTSAINSHIRKIAERLVGLR
ncbi:MAG: PhoU domain-containing protein [Candidatus Omnitrophota bacterium]